MSKNKMQKVAEMLGVEIGQEFMAKEYPGTLRYRVTEKDFQVTNGADEWTPCGALPKFLAGTLTVEPIAAETKSVTYQDVIEEFTRACNARQLSDDYLEENKCETRADVQIAIEFNYGIVYLRDDAVELLIQRIKELEGTGRK